METVKLNGKSDIGKLEIDLGYDEHSLVEFEIDECETINDSIGHYICHGFAGYHSKIFEAVKTVRIVTVDGHDCGPLCKRAQEIVNQKIKSGEIQIELEQ